MSENVDSVPRMLKKASDGITAAQAAERIGVDAQTVRNWIKTGKLPATEFGPEGARVVRIDPADLEGLGPRPVKPQSSGRRSKPEPAE